MFYVFLFMYMGVCLNAHMYSMCVPGAERPEEGVQYLLNWSLFGCLELNPGSLQEHHALNHRVITPALGHFTPST